MFYPLEIPGWGFGQKQGVLPKSCLFLMLIHKSQQNGEDKDILSNSCDCYVQV